MPGLIFALPPFYSQPGRELFPGCAGELEQVPPWCVIYVLRPLSFPFFLALFFPSGFVYAENSVIPFVAKYGFGGRWRCVFDPL